MPEIDTPTLDTPSTPDTPDTGNLVGGGAAGSTSTTTTPSAPTPSPVAGPFIQSDGSFVENWVDRLPEDMRVDSIKNPNFKNVNDVLRGYINAQRLIGKKGVIVPSENSPPEEVSEYRKATGVPEKIEEYQVKPEALPEGITWDDNYVKPFLELAHKHNIPQRAMKEMVATHLQLEQQRGQIALQLAQQDAERKFAEGSAALQQAWGRDGDFHRRKIVAAADAEGCPLDTPGFNDPNMCKFIANLLRNRSEDRSVSPTAGNGMTPGERAHDIQNNPDNAEYAAYRGIGREPDPAVQAKVRALHVEEERRKRALTGGA